MNRAVALIIRPGLTLTPAIVKPVICCAVFDRLANIRAMPARERAADRNRDSLRSPTVGVSTTWRAERLSQGINMPS